MSAIEKDGKILVSAEILKEPSFIAAHAIASLSGGDRNIKVVRELQDSIELLANRVKSGDLSDLEQILTSQVLALNALFGQLTSKGSGFLSDSAILKALPNHPKTLLNVALKAQNQCRATIQTINELKNPKKTTFIKNQLNNVQMELEQRIEALEEGVADHGSKSLDGSTEASAIRENQEMETVGVFHRSKNTAGEGS